jgi:Ca-activated chloride channel family protein
VTPSEPSSGETTEAGGPVKTDTPKDDDSTPYALIGGLGGGALLLIVLGIWAVLRLRKPVAPQQQYPGQQYPPNRGGR